MVGGRMPPGHPVDGSIAHRILLAIHQSGPLSGIDIGKQLIMSPSKVVKPISLLVLGEWLTPGDDDPVTYRLTEKAIALINKPKPAWDDEEHRAWMEHYREIGIQRARRDFLQRRGQYGIR